MIKLEEKFNRYYNDLLEGDEQSDKTVLSREQQKALSDKYNVCPTCGRPIPKYFKSAEPSAKELKYGKDDEFNKIPSSVKIKNDYETYSDLIINFIIPVLQNVREVSFCTDNQQFVMREFFGIDTQPRTAEDIANSSNKSATAVINGIASGIKNFQKYLMYHGVESNLPRQVQWSDLKRAKEQFLGK